MDVRKEQLYVGNGVSVMRYIVTNVTKCHKTDLKLLKCYYKINFDQYSLEN